MDLYSARTCRNAVDRMREDGLVLTDLAHRADGQLHGSSVWRLSPQQNGQELPFHRFAQVPTQRRRRVLQTEPDRRSCTPFGSW
jgi:hypothetical protein